MPAVTCSAVTLAGRTAVHCKDTLGGITKAYIGVWNVAGEAAIGTVTSGAMSDATASILVYEYEVNRNTSNFQQTINGSVENGTIYYTQTLTLEFAKPDAGLMNEITNLGTANLFIVVVDKNGVGWAMGHERGADLVGGTMDTGTNLGDKAFFSCQFSAETTIPAPTVPLTGTSNITYTAAV